MCPNKAQGYSIEATIQLPGDEDSFAESQPSITGHFSIEDTLNSGHRNSSRLTSSIHAIKQPDLLHTTHIIHRNEFTAKVTNANSVLDHWHSSKTQEDSKATAASAEHTRTHIMDA